MAGTSVPNEIFEFYESWKTRVQEADPNKHSRKTYGIAAQKNDLELVHKLIHSSQMEFAWRAIKRRATKVHPSLFMKIVIQTASALRRFDKLPTKEEREALQTLKDTITSAIEKYAETGETWGALTRMPESIQLRLDFVSKKQSFLRAMVKKPGAKDARRTFLVRLMSNQMSSTYGQPLHNIVAATVAVILDEVPLDTSHVRKLVAGRDEIIDRWWLFVGS